jgi:hypothetical protein
VGGGEEEGGVVDKDEFIKHYLRPKITIWFDEGQFVCGNDVILREREAVLEEVGNYFCPWYYDVETGKELSAPFEDILDNLRARLTTVKDVRKNQFPSKGVIIGQYIQDFKGRTEESLCAFPVATDDKSGKTLVLDGNKTLVALYQSWAKDKKVPIVEIYGSNLIRILPDFRVMYRS